MTLSSNINPAFPQLKVGQVVVYDYLHAAKTWQWTLGTVREITDYTAVVQQWGPHTGDSDTLRSILLREVDTENGRMKSYQDMLALAREKLASIRRSNEDRVSRVRGHFDKAREETMLTQYIGEGFAPAQVRGILRKEEFVGGSLLFGPSPDNEGPV
ncbi:hypothetical protein IOCL2690_000325200, partial [Leishmania lindenbergi]